MRAKASQIVLIAALTMGAPSGFASSTKSKAHKPVAASTMHAKAKPTGHEPKPVATRHVASKTSKSPATAHSQPTGRSQKSEPKVVATREKRAPIARQTESAPVPEPAPEPDDIQVTHDRKQHFSPASAEPKTEPRKATSEDFLTPFAAAAGNPTRPAAVAPSPEPAKHKTATLEAKPATPTVQQAEPLPAIVPVLFTRQGRLIVPPALKGSHEILLRQNEMADREGLDRVRDDADLEHMREDKLLVAIPASPGLQLDERLPLNRRYCRPWTAQFLTAMSQAYYARFHTPLQVNSAVRTVEFQQRLLMTNGNAAPAEGETASPHLTGQAVDLAKHGLSMTQIAWVRGYLLPLVQAGKVDVEEEFQQACFHISVYRKYVPEPAPKREVTGTHTGAATTLATAIR